MDPQFTARQCYEARLTGMGLGSTRWLAVRGLGFAISNSLIWYVSSIWYVGYHLLRVVARLAVGAMSPTIGCVQAGVTPRERLSEVVGPVVLCPSYWVSPLVRCRNMGVGPGAPHSPLGPVRVRGQIF